MRPVGPTLWRTTLMRLSVSVPPGGGGRGVNTPLPDVEATVPSPPARGGGRGSTLWLPSPVAGGGAKGRYLHSVALPATGGGRRKRTPVPLSHFPSARAAVSASSPYHKINVFARVDSKRPWLRRRERLLVTNHLSTYTPGTLQGNFKASCASYALRPHPRRPPPPQRAYPAPRRRPFHP